MTEIVPGIDLEIADHIAEITLNRPDRMNALTPEMTYGLVEAFERTDADDDVRAVIVTGAGAHFCAGADLRRGDDSFMYENGGETSEIKRDGDVFTLRMFESLKPIIGAINGAAIGAGVTMILPMDVRLASTEARFGLVFTRRGILPEAASSWFLPRVVGISTAMEWTSTGRIFDAFEAKERGLVRSLHAPHELLPAARTIAREIADNASPVSVAATRRMMWEMLTANHPMRAHEWESQLLVTRGKSADAVEGVSAFIEKRAARFPMKVSADLPPVPRFSGRLGG
jgi:enoyl-CoA hydratase/carnithine racemase